MDYQAKIEELERRIEKLEQFYPTDKEKWMSSFMAGVSSGLESAYRSAIRDKHEEFLTPQ